MLTMCREQCYYDVREGLPKGMTVEHIDHNRQHNCPENLMLLDSRIHDYISSHHWLDVIKPDIDRKVEEANMPDWVKDRAE
jgi:hypothetical protein